MTNVRERFLDDLASCGASHIIAERWYKIVEGHYSHEPQRRYHNIQHLSSMLECADRHQDALIDPLAVRLAIYFHDIICDPKRHDNELKSIEVFREFVKDVPLSPASVTQVCSYIERTITHTLVEGSCEDNDLQYFLDFDLEILSRSEEMYDYYAAQIRMEYEHHPTSEYSVGRGKVLRHFLERERLFFTDAFKGDLERRARENLEREIHQLERHEKLHPRHTLN